MKNIDTDVIGKNYNATTDGNVDNKLLIAINEIIRFHDIEIVGAELREAMTAMKPIAIG